MCEIKELPGFYKWLRSRRTLYLKQLQALESFFESNTSITPKLV